MSDWSILLSFSVQTGQVTSPLKMHSATYVDTSSCVTLHEHHIVNGRVRLTRLAVGEVARLHGERKRLVSRLGSLGCACP